MASFDLQVGQIVGGQAVVDRERLFAVADRFLWAVRATAARPPPRPRGPALRRRRPLGVVGEAAGSDAPACRPARPRRGGGGRPLVP